MADAQAAVGDVHINRRVLDWWKRNPLYVSLCFYCGVSLTTVIEDSRDMPDNLATKDHIEPKSKHRGKSKGRNIVKACRKCNCDKGDKLLFQWRDGRVFYGEKLYQSRQIKTVIPDNSEQGKAVKRG